MGASEPEKAAQLARLAEVYAWDLGPEEAAAWPSRLLRRVMDIGTLEDVVLLERTVGGKALKEALATADIGALRPQSWSFWHYRLGLAKGGENLPPPPTGRTG